MTTARTSLRPGALLSGRYEVLRLIGAGARKQVHVAHDTWLDRDVAVCAVQGDPEEAARLRREAALLARLGDHPCIVGVHDLLEVDGAPVMVCQYLPGGALHEALHGAPLEVEAALRIATDVATALGRVHQHEVVHRDVKPANIWLDEQGRAVLGDFGLAVGAGVDGQPYDLLAGTATYAAPEQIVGDRGGPRSDLYSLGAVLFELLTGRPPLEEPSLLGVISKVLQEAPPAPSAAGAAAASSGAAARWRRCGTRSPRRPRAGAASRCCSVKRGSARRGRRSSWRTPPLPRGGRC